MALQLNLLHEEILEQRQRQRDPLKIGMLVLASCGALLFIYYAWAAYRTLEIKNRLAAVERDWKQVEPRVTAAQKRSAELNGIIDTTRVLNDYIANRFFWAPFLERVAHCVAPNTQLTGLDGTLHENGTDVTVNIGGVAAAREPRSAAEDLRQMLLEQLKQNYHNVKVEFKALEDLDTSTSVSGMKMPMAHFTIAVNFEIREPAKPKPTSGQKKRR
jgi:hypothetical protein